ncbi:MAG: hypothetical protein GX749_05745, partial [Ruminococcaceae bacterium]|nr:hypothetical protein [Oscillospiraceae bacterium]
MKKRLQIILFLLVLLSLLGWRAVRDLNDNLAGTSRKPADLLWNLGLISTEARPLTDNQAVYGDAAEDSEVLPLYVVVLPTQTEDGVNVTFSDLNAITDFRTAKPRLNAFTTADRQEALNFAAGVLSGNSTITLRGHSTLTSEKKSYKIRLNSETKAWQGQMTINLNKHPNDESRMRNKIAFDLLRLIPDLTSMQSRFVHLQVLDLSETAGVDT